MVRSSQRETALWRLSRMRLNAHVEQSFAAQVYSGASTPQGFLGTTPHEARGGGAVEHGEPEP
jgi:hypothetical protein